MPKDKKPEAVIRRLPKYYRYFSALQAEGVERISSAALSEKMNINASQIRQDFSNFGGFGQQGYGYHVESLKKEIGDILGLNKKYKCIIVGAGNVGQALVGYKSFEHEGFIIEALFDNNEAITGQTVSGKPIYPLEKLREYIGVNKVDIGIIAVPAQNAMDTAKLLAEFNVSAIWNFAPVDIIIDGVQVENVHLSDSLWVLGYRLKQGGREQRV